jgi:hypothetical protein
MTDLMFMQRAYCGRARTASGHTRGDTRQVTTPHDSRVPIHLRTSVAR